MASDPLTLEERRLWIGNLDTRMTEYQLLKILQKCGNIEKFDMLFHKSGPQAGQPRGFAFVTYKNVDESLTALDKLNGKLIGSKHVIVRLAKNINYDELEKPKQKIDIPVLAAGGSLKDRKISKEIAIQAIEAKLRSLESKKDDDFEINKVHSNEIPLIQKYQFNKNDMNKDMMMMGSSSSSICGGNNNMNSGSNIYNSGVMLNKAQTSSRHHYTKSRSGPYNKNKSNQKKHHGRR